MGFMARGVPADGQAQQTMNDLSELQRLEPAALKTLVLSELSSEVEAKISSEAAHGNVHPQNPLEAMLGPFLAANQMAGNAQHNPWEQPWAAKVWGRAMVLSIPQGRLLSTCLDNCLA